MDRCRRVDGLADVRCCSDDVRGLRTPQIWTITSRSKALLPAEVERAALRAEIPRLTMRFGEGRRESDVGRDLSARRLARTTLLTLTRVTSTKAEAVPKRRLRPEGMAEARAKAELELRGFDASPGELAHQGAVQALAMSSYSSVRVHRSAASRQTSPSARLQTRKPPASVELKTVHIVHLPDRSRTVLEKAACRPSRLFCVAAGAAQTYGAPLKKNRSAPCPSSPTPSPV